LVAGKGHEDYQIVGHEKHHLDDREEVRRASGPGTGTRNGSRRGGDSRPRTRRGRPPARSSRSRRCSRRRVGPCRRSATRRAFPASTTDSRALGAGELFVAIRGDTHDGHAFVGDAAGRGAGAVVVEQPLERAAPGCGVILVRDTLAALGHLAAFHRRRRRPRVVAITGSNGKTTTKEMLAAILERAPGVGRVLRTTGTQNNLVGLPLTLLRLADTDAIAVVELGMNGPGEIWRLAEIAEPDVGVITCVARHTSSGSARSTASPRRRRSSTAAPAVGHRGRERGRPAGGGRGRRLPGRKVPFGTGSGLPVAAAGIADRGLEGSTSSWSSSGARRPCGSPSPVGTT